MKAKEEELNSIIMELRKTIEALQEKCAKEESAKLVGGWAKIMFHKFGIFVGAFAVANNSFVSELFDILIRKRWILLVERKKLEMQQRNCKLQFLKSSRDLNRTIQVQIRR